MKKVLMLVAGLLLCCVCTACAVLSDEQIKLRDLEFTVLSEELVPEELMTIIKEKKGEPFKLTYSDNDYLYISIGYGKQETGGYSIAVNELYLTDNAICVSTALLGPEANANPSKKPSCPYIVIKTEYLDETVLFE